MKKKLFKVNRLRSIPSPKTNIEKEGRPQVKIKKPKWKDDPKQDH